MKRVFATVVLLSGAACAALVLAGCNKSASQPATSSSLSIAMIPKGTTHTFWQSIHAGANRAGKELGVEVIWRGPLREDDRDSQVSEVEGFISRGVSGIVLAPLDEAALVGPVNDAMSKKIPVVIFDSGLKGDNYVSFVATDNVKGGQLGGERLIEAMGGQGKVVLLRYAEGHDSTTKREEGFLAAMKAHPTVQVVSSNQYVGTDVEEAYKRTESILSGYRKPDGSLSIDGIFCANESSSFAAMRVLKDNGWAGKLHFVGSVKREEEKNEIWNAIKTIPEWRNEVVADIKVTGGGAAATAGKTYTVKAGDTLSKIAKQHLGDANAYMKIYELNRDQLSNPDLIKPGQVLKLP